jgi:hypothetical protein
MLRTNNRAWHGHLNLSCLKYNLTELPTVKLTTTTRKQLNQPKMRQSIQSYRQARHVRLLKISNSVCSLKSISYHELSIYYSWLHKFDPFSRSAWRPPNGVLWALIFVWTHKMTLQNLHKYTYRSPLIEIQHSSLYLDHSILYDIRVLRQHRVNTKHW